MLDEESGIKVKNYTCKQALTKLGDENGDGVKGVVNKLQIEDKIKG